MDYMSNTPYGGTPAGPTPWMPQGVPSKGPSRVPVIVALVLSLAALGLAAAACFRPAPKSEAVTPEYSEQEVDDAKKAVCVAYETSHAALVKAASFRSDDPDKTYTIAMNVRLAFNTAADHLLAQLAKNVATPIELANAATDLAISYQEMVLNQTAGNEQALDAVYKRSDDAEAIVKRDCQ